MSLVTVTKEFLVCLQLDINYLDSIANYCLLLGINHCLLSVAIMKYSCVRVFLGVRVELAREIGI